MDTQIINMGTKHNKMKATCGFVSIRKLIMVLKSSWNAFMTKDSSNDIKPIGAPIIQKPLLGVRKFGEVIWMHIILVETNLHISLTKWKALMLQIPFVIIKGEYHIWNTTNNMHIIDKKRKKAGKVGCYNKVENTKMC